MNRKAANLRILEMLESLIHAHPEMRFTQILFNADVLVTTPSPDGSAPVVTNEFNLEPKVLLERVRRSKVWEQT